MFNRELADELLEDRDRDTARFFAGRDDEIQRFDAAVREAQRSKQAVRFYLGAPGCGKHRWPNASERFVPSACCSSASTRTT